MKPRYRLLLELLSALALFGIVTAVTARTQHHTTVYSGHGWDGRFYYSVAEQFAQGKKPVSFAPYVYRVGTPFLAALFSPSDVMKGFYIANIAAAGLLVILLVVWLRMFIESWLVRAVLVALFVSQWHAPTRFVFFIANGTDAWAMLFCLAGLICVEKLRVKMTRGVFVLLCLIALVGPFFREFAAIVGLAFAFIANPIRYDHGFKIRRLSPLWLVPLGLSFIGVLASHAAVERISSSYSFIGQLLFTGYHQPIFMYLHAWLMAYGPVLFLLIIGWRLVGRFLGEHQSLLVFLACIAGLSWVGGDDTERFALWTMPVIYVLCGKVIEDNFALLRSAPLLAFMAATQAISARVFWAIPDEWGGKDPSLVFLTPFRNASYLNLYSHYAPKMALSFAEYCLVGMILLGWIYLRSIRQGDGVRAHLGCNVEVSLVWRDQLHSSRSERHHFRRPVGSHPGRRSGITCDEASGMAAINRGRTQLLLLTLLGTYLNLAAYGFKFNTRSAMGFMLAMANWLRNPSLYPGDPMRQAFTRFPSMFWYGMAKLSAWLPMENLLFLVSIITKLIFFYAIARLVRHTVTVPLFRALIVVAIALSPFVNTVATPFGATQSLDQIGAHCYLSISLLTLAGVLLVEGHWRTAAIAASAGVYFDALPFVFTLPAFAWFACLDWVKQPNQRSRIIQAALLGVVCSGPWLLLSYGALDVTFPDQFVEAARMFNPRQLALPGSPVSQFAFGGVILFACVLFCWSVRKLGLRPQTRLELLAVTYLPPTILGVLFGEFYATPLTLRLQLPRADSFVFLYVILLIAIYGANLLPLIPREKRLAWYAIAVVALLFPLSVRSMLPALLLLVLFEALGTRAIHEAALKLGGSPLRALLRISSPGFAATIAVMASLALFGTRVTEFRQTWNFVRSLSPKEQACWDVQEWMKSHTPADARFLVPTEGCGFRVVSERSTWGEFQDGNTMFHYPPNATMFLNRMSALGFHSGSDWPFVKAEESYGRLSWEKLSAIAAENQLDYIIQFHSTPFPVKPLYENEWYSVYRAGNSATDLSLHQGNAQSPVETETSSTFAKRQSISSDSRGQAR